MDKEALKTVILFWLSMVLLSVFIYAATLFPFCAGIIIFLGFSYGIYSEVKASNQWKKLTEDDRQ